MTVALWFASPTRRKTVLWMLFVLVSAIASFSAVFSCFVGVTSLNQVIEYTEDIAATRYLLPILVGWSATCMTLLFSDPSLRETVKYGD